MDGISQPGINGFTTSPTPGQDVLDAGIFLLKEEGDVKSAFRPNWTADGSFLAFRQLKQLVPEFKKFLADNPVSVPSMNLTREQGSALLGARMFGRWPSVCRSALIYTTHRLIVCRVPPLTLPLSSMTPPLATTALVTTTSTFLGKQTIKHVVPSRRTSERPTPAMTCRRGPSTHTEYYDLLFPMGRKFLTRKLHRILHRRSGALLLVCTRWGRPGNHPHIPDAILDSRLPV